ncbi:hypothetical protein SAMN05444354_10323 [Stigmatella aurantiaca]|uniref:Vegetative protein n=2 Tax=Stigmatella aurantiaca TaxID=41 RepID=A0A1H7KUC0_STIAU|nr:hypothetical protein SAMN05444354_10323 [Stigmatella aurantiaca]
MYTQRHMSFEKALREMIRVELTTQLRPLQKSIASLEKGLGHLERLRSMTARLAPLAASQGLKLPLPLARGAGKPAAGKAAPVKAAPAKAAPAKAAPAKSTPAKSAPAKAEPTKAPAGAARSSGKGASAAAASSGACAVIGCKRPSRSKGYCSAHYQKLRLLIRTDRRPSDWGDNAPPQSAKDVKLPRGRAAAQERQAEPQQEELKEPPKPKAWVRKKGAQGMISLN